MIAVTGAPGNIGSPLVEFLKESGESFRIGAFRPERAKGFFPQSEVVEFNFADHTTFQPFLEGCTSLFLLRPPALSDVKTFVFPFLDYAQKVGVKHLVFLSLQGAENIPVAPHRKIENYVEEAWKGSYIFVRPSFFMQNLYVSHKQEIISEGSLIIPAGNGKTAFVDCKDVAEISALSLTKKFGKTAAYEITGEESLTYYEVAEALSEALEKEVVYTRPGLLRYMIHRRKLGDHWSYILTTTAIYTTARLGLASKTTTTFEELVGKKPNNLKDFLAREKDQFFS